MYLSNRLNFARKYRSWSYKRLTRSANVWSFDRESLLKEGYYSQCGQDKWLTEQMYPGLHNGVFVDIGAHDGISFSNTYFLEARGWTGIAIEPLSDVFARLEKNRNCIKINGCISDKSGKARFRKISGYSEMLSGLIEQYDPRHLNRIEREVKFYGGAMEEIEVVCYRLDDLLKKSGFLDIDYMNIDVEGAEYEILRSIDFDAVNIKVCGIENNYKDYRIPSLMKEHGYDCVAIVGDEFYVKAGLPNTVSG